MLNYLTAAKSWEGIRFTRCEGKLARYSDLTGRTSSWMSESFCGILDKDMGSVNDQHLL